MLHLDGINPNGPYGYDQSGRLTTVTKADATVSYSFDDNGNRLTKLVVDGAGTSLFSGSYDDQDRLLNYADCSYQYTDNGELKQKRCGTGVDEQITLYQYDVQTLIRPPTINQQHNAAVTSFQFNVQQSTEITDTRSISAHYTRRTGDF